VAAAGSEILTPAGRRWAERAQRPLDVLAVVFLIDMILIWSFPAGPPAFLRALDVIAWIVWASFAVDYIARLLSGNKGGFVRTTSWTCSWSSCRCCGCYASSCSTVCRQ